MGFYSFVRVLAKFVFFLFFRVRFEGLENIPESGNFILCSNHRSNLDPFFLGVKIEKRVNYMAKSELFKNKFFAKIFLKLGAFPVYRGTGDMKAIEKAVDIINSGEVLAIFPEGTRSKDGIPLKPKSGISLIAAKTKADILPAAIFFRGKLGLFKKITVRYGKIIKYEEIPQTEQDVKSMKATSNFIMGKIISLLEEK